MQPLAPIYSAQLMPKILLRYDMRAPAFGASAEVLYAAALEQASWADSRGFDAVQVSEHHGSDDGYLPSPIVLLGAIAARTQRLRLQIAALVLPLNDPLRVAEDLAVLDILSGGRVELVVVAGYVPAEFAMFDRALADRSALVEEGIGVLKRAWTGEPFVYRGRSVRITPRPLQRPRPPILLGGSSPAAARRAARIADGFVPAVKGVYADYLRELSRLGASAPPGGGQGPLFLHVCDDPERDWALIAPHALHEMNAYGRWMSETQTAGPYHPVQDAATVRQTGLYRVVTPEECIALAKELGPDGTLLLHPLMGGLAPELGWASLETFEAKVMPALAD